MNFEKLWIVYPEARKVSREIHEVIGLVSAVDANIPQIVPGDSKVVRLPEYGHHGISAETDVVLQGYILEHLSRAYPTAHFIVEEKSKDPLSCVITGDGHALHEFPLIYGVDPIDGTAHFRHTLWEWSISIGVMEHGIHRGGVIYAPCVNGGMCVVGERGKGVFLLEEGGSTVRRAHISPLERKESILFVGVDLMWMPAFNAFLNEAAKESLVARAVGSCALGLAAVAAGKVGALVQPVQKPWDWFAGYPLVEETGGKVQFYHYRDGQIILLDAPDRLAYSSVKPLVGFIAGNPKMVEWLTELLVNTYGEI